MGKGWERGRRRDKSINKNRIALIITGFAADEHAIFTLKVRPLKSAFFHLNDASH